MLRCPKNGTRIDLIRYGENYPWFSFLINEVTCNCLVAFGIISNIIILIVFTVNRHLLLKPLVRYFIGLIVFDLFVLAGTWLLISWKIFHFSPMLGSYCRNLKICIEDEVGSGNPPVGSD